METNSLGYQVSGGCRGDLTTFMRDGKRASCVAPWRATPVPVPARKDLPFLVTGPSNIDLGSSRVKHPATRSQGNIKP